MRIRQVMFWDIPNQEYHGGIQLENGDIICGCCGGLLKADEEGTEFEITKTYDNWWISLDETICGDDLGEEP